MKSKLPTRNFIFAKLFEIKPPLPIIQLQFRPICNLSNPSDEIGMLLGMNAEEGPRHFTRILETISKYTSFRFDDRDGDKAIWIDMQTDDGKKGCWLKIFNQDPENDDRCNEFLKDYSAKYQRG